MENQAFTEAQERKNVPRSLFPSDLENANVPQTLFYLAKAYLDSSIILFNSIIEGAHAASFGNALTACFLLQHSLELFLKGAIAQAGRAVPADHDTEKLYKQFKNLFQGKKFDFEGDIVAATSVDPQAPYNEFTRYLIDTKGRPWSKNYHISPTIWLEQGREFRKDYDRLIPLIETRYALQK